MVTTMLSDITGTTVGRDKRGQRTAKLNSINNNHDAEFLFLLKMAS